MTSSVFDSIEDGSEQRALNNNEDGFLLLTSIFQTMWTIM